MNNIERINLFTLNAFTVRIDDVDLDQVNKDIDAMEEFKVSFDPKDTHFEDRKFPATPACDRLKQRMLEEVCRVTGVEMRCETIWTITLYEGQSVNYHTHKSNTHLYPDEYYSVAFYTKVPKGSADFIFYFSICNALEQTVSITPEAGKMTVFNSYVPHMTGRHHAEESRIVVSANYVPINPNTKPSPDWSDYNAD